MLPILAVVVICGFLVLHFTGVLDDLGQRTARRTSARALRPTGRPAGEKEMDRRLKVFENFIENLTRPEEDAEHRPGGAGQDNSPKD